MFKATLYKYIFLLPILVGLIVQVIKMFLYSMVNRKMDYGRILRAGGMPNLHSAVFCALSAGIGIKYGYSTLLFSVVGAYSVIIIHDTLRLKREKEKQTHIINSIISSIYEFGKIDGAEVKGMLQFRVFDIVAGGILGGALAYLLIY
jgi:acid phosphatase family membrane protein YuiD